MALTYTVTADKIAPVSGDITQYFNIVTQEFDWTPQTGDAGIYTLTFEVSDGELTDTQTMTIEVVDLSLIHI